MFVLNEELGIWEGRGNDYGQTLVLPSNLFCKQNEYITFISDGTHRYENTLLNYCPQHFLFVV